MRAAIIENLVRRRVRACACCSRLERKVSPRNTGETRRERAFNNRIWSRARCAYKPWAEREARARVTRVRVALALEDCAISLPLHSSPTRIDIFFSTGGTCAPPLLNADYSAARSAVAI